MPPSLAQLLSAHAHAALPHANPLSPAQMQAVADAVVTAAPASVLDIGCGPATAAIEIARSLQAVVTAVDANDEFIARARNAAHALTLRGKLHLVAGEFEAAQFSQQDAVLCMGSSQVFGKPTEALAECVKLTAQHGLIVFADLVWTNAPSDEFLSFLGVDPNFYWLRSDAVRVFGQFGLTIDQHLSASAESFAEYEREVNRGRLDFADSMPAPDSTEIRARAAAWSSAYERYGKQFLGFDVYVARRSEA